MNSRDKEKKPFIIMSGKTDTKDHYEALRSMIVDSGLAWKPISGVWRGESERSFLVEFDQNVETQRSASIAIVVSCLTTFEQEAILHVASNRDVYLFDKDKPTLLGRMTEVPEAEAIGYESYSFDPLSGRYFVVVSK